jgi:hypothetical protein
MSRPTPETDAFAASEFVDKIDELTQLYDLSEKLERERDEAREDAQKSKAYKRVLKVTNENLKRERDDARGALMRIEDSMKENTDYNESRLR